MRIGKWAALLVLVGAGLVGCASVVPSFNKYKFESNFGKNNLIYIAGLHAGKAKVIKIEKGFVIEFDDKQTFDSFSKKYKDLYLRTCMDADITPDYFISDRESLDLLYKILKLH